MLGIFVVLIDINQEKIGKKRKEEAEEHLSTLKGDLQNMFHQ